MRLQFINSFVAGIRLVSTGFQPKTNIHFLLN